MENSNLVIERRIRNGMIEYWKLVSSFVAQQEYQKNVPHVFVPNEIICQWEDWQTFDDPAGQFSPPVFSAEESAAIVAFHQLWLGVAASTPDPLPQLDELKMNAEWKKLMTGAEEALRVFKKRGLSPA